MPVFDGDDRAVLREVATKAQMRKRHAASDKADAKAARAKVTPERILKLLRARKGTTVSDIANRLGTSDAYVRGVLKKLIAAGKVKVDKNSPASMVYKGSRKVGVRSPDTYWAE
jgi:predicted transcriptional regulator